MKKKSVINVRKFIVLLAAIVLFAALFPVPGSCYTGRAVVSTAAADYSSGAHSVISMGPAGGPRTVQNNLLPTSVSDVTVAAYGDFFYRIERFQADNITKFHVDAPDLPIWQFSTMDGMDGVSSNPYDLIFVSNEKAYLLLYGKTTMWIVNPSATTQEGFKIGEVDLSAYADSDGIPEMNSAVIANGKLFVSMQRRDRDNGWAPSNDSYVAVVDTMTDSEINTGIPNDEGLQGIKLPVRSPGAIQYLVENGMIYLQGVGDYGSSSQGRDPEYSGGIVRIDPNSYAVSMVVDDGDAENHPYGNISGMGIVSPQKGYFVGYSGWGDNTLYMFDPTTGQVMGVANDYLQNKNIAGMEAGAFADDNSMLWVSNATDAEVVILNTADNSIDEKISTNLNPTRVVFLHGTEETFLDGNVEVVPATAGELSKAAMVVTGAGDGSGGMEVAQFFEIKANVPDYDKNVDVYYLLADPAKNVFCVKPNGELVDTNMLVNYDAVTPYATNLDGALTDTLVQGMQIGNGVEDASPGQWTVIWTIVPTTNGDKATMWSNGYTWGWYFFNAVE